MLEAANPDFAAGQATAAPDGDAHVDRPAAAFVVPACPHCGGLLKPDVVFFGESVPREVVATCTRALDHADALLCVGTSLMVYSGFRFCRHAAASGKPVAALNLGATRADDLLAHKFAAPCAETLQAAVGLLGIQTDAERSW